MIIFVLLILERWRLHIGNYDFESFLLISLHCSIHCIVPDGFLLLFFDVGCNHTQTRHPFALNHLNSGHISPRRIFMASFTPIYAEIGRWHYIFHLRWFNCEEELCEHSATVTLIRPAALPNFYSLIFLSFDLLSDLLLLI